MTKIKDYSQLPSPFKKKESYDPFLIGLLAFLLIGMLFVLATKYRQTVLETQRLREALGTAREESMIVIEAPPECGEQLKNTVGESSLLIMKLK